MLRRSLAVVALAAAFFSGGAIVFAGTTGSIAGVILSHAGAPIPDAKVYAASPSQSATVTTDASGRFLLLSLAPDTYTITVSKAGYETAVTTGVSVFADQSQNLRVSLGPALKTIATVTTRSSMDVVKPGTTSDVYSVNATVTKAVQGVGGGGNLNNAYSAIATVPGAFVPPNQQGWNQVVYIRGGNFDQIGYEFDGVPVNRSFDNYPGGTAGTLGQQELQVYAGGGTAGESASGLAGFINQVIKTGTSPGYAGVNAGIGSPSFYHSAQFEVGGATPDRMFSYYVGIGGYNQDYRYLDQFNGSALPGAFGFTTIADNASNLINFPGVYPTCGFAPPAGAGFFAGSNSSAIYDPFSLKPGQPGFMPLPRGVAFDPGCYNFISPAYASYSNLTNRESVINLHFGIPHRRDAGRDDVQVLYDNNMLLSQFYSSANDIGPHLVLQLNQLNIFRGFSSASQLSQATPEIWGDFLTWPGGTSFGENAARTHVIPYFEPASPSGRCANVTPEAAPGTPALVPGGCPGGAFSQIPMDTRDGFWNNASIFKLQYQHNIGSNAYFRIYGYTFYSDWLQNGPLSFASGLFSFGVLSYDYELNSHTRGLAFSFADQVNSQHLLTFDANYTTATTNRYNNTNFNNTPGAFTTNYTNGVDCFNPANGKRSPCNGSASAGSFEQPTRPVAVPVPGASWQVTYTGNSGFVNTVTPVFSAFALQDHWNPSDKLNVELGLREEIYQFNLANTTNDGQNFWFAAGQQEFCYNPVTLQPYVIPAPPASGFPATPFVGFKCPVDKSIPAHPVQTVHPDGQNGHLLLSNNYGPTITDTALTPRLGLTYTVSNDTVLRFSAGRYAQQPQTYQVQYASKDNNLAQELFQAFWQYGYTTPRHDPLVQFSNNFDASYEHRFKGTDMSIKVSPYFRYATNQIYGVGLPFGLAGGFNSGTQRVDGVELEFAKGDFDKDGLSFILSYTYTNSAEKWNNFPGSSINPIDPYNQDIANYNGLTRTGGGVQCYENDRQGNLFPDPACKQLSPGYNPPIWNPYYGAKAQPLIDRNGWYPVGLDFPYLSPNVVSAIVNYKRGKFAITPALTFNEGQPYGSPSGVVGLDPRTCTGNSSAMLGGIAQKNPLQADYTTCSLADTQNGTSPGTLFIPDPATGVFDTFGAFRQPSQLNLSMSLSYEVNPRVRASVVLTNLANACFGGTKAPWTQTYPPNSFSCGYIPNAYYVANFYNGLSPNDRAANGVPLNPNFVQPYIPAYADTNALVLPGPFNAYFQVNFKL
jgi:hypothetical protein